MDLPDRHALLPERSHLASCARCQRALEAIQAARAHFEAAVLPRTMDMVEQRARRRFWHRSLARWSLLPALAAAAALVLVVHGRDVPSAPEPELGIKGAATLRVFVQRSGRGVQVRDGDRLAPGDQIRFVVQPGGARYVLVASVDGTGNATIYFPYDGRESGRIADDPRIELPGSIVLDAAAGPERIYALFSREPVRAETVKRRLGAIGARGPEAIRHEKRLDVAGVGQASLLFEKATP